MSQAVRPILMNAAFIRAPEARIRMSEAKANARPPPLAAQRIKALRPVQRQRQDVSGALNQKGGVCIYVCHAHSRAVAEHYSVRPYVMHGRTGFRILSC